MRLNTLKKGQSASITAIHAEKELKNRFNSFGVIKGAVVTVERCTLGRKTMEIRINKTRMAIRLSEAETIEIGV